MVHFFGAGEGVRQWLSGNRVCLEEEVKSRKNKTILDNSRPRYPIICVYETGSALRVQLASSRNLPRPEVNPELAERRIALVPMARIQLTELDGSTRYIKKSVALLHIRRGTCRLKNIELGLSGGIELLSGHVESTSTARFHVFGTAVVLRDKLPVRTPFGLVLSYPAPDQSSQARANRLRLWKLTKSQVAQMVKDEAEKAAQALQPEQA